MKQRAIDALPPWFASSPLNTSKSVFVAMDTDSMHDKDFYIFLHFPSRTFIQGNGALQTFEQEHFFQIIHQIHVSLSFCPKHARTRARTQTRKSAHVINLHTLPVHS